MKNFSKSLGCFAVGLALTACDKFTDARYHNGLVEADKRVHAMDYEGALRVYESLIDGSPKTAEAHYRLGHIYADHLKDPLGALYHFTRYLAVAPEGQFGKEARSYEQEGQIRLMNHLSKGAPLTQEEAARIKNENLALKKTLAELRAVKTPPAGAAVAGKSGDLTQKPIPPGARTHVVAKGDTLASIATKFYKNKARAKDILDANFYSADAATKLKIGQTLTIP